MKLILISHEPYREKMRYSYCMDEFKKDGIEVFYWCVQKVFKYSCSSIYNNVDVAADVINYKEYSSLLTDLQALERDTIICLEVWFNKDTIQLFEIIKQHNFSTFRIDHYRNQPIKSSISEKLLRSLKQGDFRRLLMALRQTLRAKIFDNIVKWRGIEDNSVTFIPGKLAELSSTINHPVISITHFDYLDFEKTKSGFMAGGQKYIVFLDIYLPYHPDITRLGLHSISPELYFKALNRLFDDVEAQTNFKVIIAAHPKASYTNEFNGRLCISGKTVELVMNAEAVLAHHSSAINFAVLYKKKIGLLSSIIFESAKSKSYILRNIFDLMKGYQNELKCSIFDMDQPFVYEDLSEIDNVAYENFVDNYLKSKEYPLTNYQIIKKELNLTTGTHGDKK